MKHCGIAPLSYGGQGLSNTNCLPIVCQMLVFWLPDGVAEQDHDSDVDVDDGDVDLAPPHESLQHTTSVTQ